MMKIVFLLSFLLSKTKVEAPRQHYSHDIFYVSIFFYILSPSVVLSHVFQLPSTYASLYYAMLMIFFPSTPKIMYM